MEPATVEAMRGQLQSKDKKAMRDLLAVLLPALFPHEKPSGTGPARVTLISHVDRTGVSTTATKIETPS